MGTQKPALNVAGVIFLVIAILHLVRVIFKWEAVINSHSVPMPASLMAFVVFFLLSLWMFKSNC
jgi:hypothetical protein